MELADLIREARGAKGDENDTSGKSTCEDSQKHDSSASDGNTSGDNASDSASNCASARNGATEEPMPEKPVRQPLALKKAARALRMEGSGESDGPEEEPLEPSLVFAMQAATRAKRMESRACCVDPRDLCGNWNDSFGNTVCVYSLNAFEAHLIATLSNPPRRDFNLPITRLPNGRGWRCGGATLASSSPNELVWRFSNGKSSVWSWRGGASCDDASTLRPAIAVPMPPSPDAHAAPTDAMPFYCLVPVPKEY